MARTVQRDTVDERTGPPVTESRTESVVSVGDLTKVYGDGNEAVQAVDGVSFEIGAGEVVGLLGPNGAGKTTIIKTILGLIEPTEGDVTVNGVDPHEDGTTTYHHVGAVLEGARNVYWRLTVRENLRFFTGLQGTHPNEAREEHDRLLSLVGLEEKADETVRNLSRGMQQKAVLACTLARRTPVVFLDEPTLGLDVQAAHDLREEIRRLADEENRTIVMCSHDMDVIQSVCDRVVIVDRGEIVADDSVSNLVDVFNTQSYRIELSEPRSLSDPAFPNDAEIEWIDDDVFEVVLRSGDALYDLMRTLEDTGVTVTAIESIQPDLEEVFLRVIDGDTGKDAGRIESDGGEW